MEKTVSLGYQNKKNISRPSETTSNVPYSKLNGAWLVLCKYVIISPSLMEDVFPADMVLVVLCSTPVFFEEIHKYFRYKETQV